MKKYYVTVNGNRYEVEVEEVKENFQASPAPTAFSEAKPAPLTKEVPNTAPAQTSAPKAAPRSISGGENIKCPMPGTIININIKEGASVEKGDLLFVLEAMKMENEIVSPIEGTVASIEVTKGQSVNADDLLAVIQ